MSPNLAIQELAIAVAAPDSNPILLTPTFLKGSGIVPQDWELARQPPQFPHLPRWRRRCRPQLYQCPLCPCLVAKCWQRTPQSQSQPHLHPQRTQIQPHH
ncbi:MAG: hypothetical protein AAGA60_32200 [Cyanobacteria bacterium P01_E01_bin.42]